MRYYEFTFIVAVNSGDALTQKVLAMGCPGIVENDKGLIAYFPENLELSRILKDLVSFKAILQSSGLNADFSFDYSLLPDTDWNETWKKSFKPMDAGSFTILPPWEKKSENRINLIIDPGMAFGTGHHETTRKCLMLLERFSSECRKKRLLDVGTGTGILAIAASFLGFEHITAVDTDPLAIDAAQRNAALNGVCNVEIISGSISGTCGIYDFITANLVSDVLSLMAGELTARLNNPGIAVLSGMLIGQEAGVIEAMERAGLTVTDKFFDGKWVSIIARRRLSKLAEEDKSL